jgi:hypothetical protein
MTADNTEHGADSLQLIASPNQLFAGMQAGLPSLTVICSRCGAQLGEGDEVSVYAYRPAESTRWYLGRCCCPNCAPTEIATPTLGTAECRITARLATVSDVARQRHRLCLADPSVVAFTSPTDGTPP